MRAPAIKDSQTTETPMSALKVKAVSTMGKTDRKTVRVVAEL